MLILSIKNIKRTRYGLFFTLLAAAYLFSCEQIIDFDVEDVEQNIVIDGSITNISENNYVKLSFTESAFKNLQAKKASGAKVVISDSDGNWESLNEISAGMFTTANLSGVYGKTYTLKVELDGHVYSGYSTLEQPLKFDAISFDKTANTFWWNILDDFYNLKFTITNNSGKDEYFLVKVSDGGHGAIYSTTAYKLNFTDGKPIEFKNTRYDFQKTTLLRIDLIAIDRNMYEYYSQLNTLSGTGDLEVSDYLEMNSFNPKTNLSGGALGYFGAYSYKTYNVIVK